MGEGICVSPLAGFPPSGEMPVCHSQPRTMYWSHEQFFNDPFDTVVMHSMITKLVHTWLASGNQIEINKKKGQKKQKRKGKAFINNSPNPELHCSGTRGAQDMSLGNVCMA